MGTGLVAGYRTSGVGQRPGFAWFFGRDSLWTSFALNAEGDYSTTRTALDFISKYQREDGKVPHEISQSASLVPWFKDYPYAYVSADATPLFIIAMNDYAVQSGDLAFARDKWDNVWRAYQFLQSTYDAQGFAQNAGIGHGWVEGGPLLPVKNEYYQAGLGVEALQALSNLARLVGKDDVSKQLAAEFERSKPALDQAFWSPEMKSYAFALKQDNQRVDEASVLATVPMWFGLPDAQIMPTRRSRISRPTITKPTGACVSSRSIRKSMTAPAITTARSGRCLRDGLRWANTAIIAPFPLTRICGPTRCSALDGSLGHFTEVLSGDYYQSFATSSPHQIWSCGDGRQSDSARHVWSADATRRNTRSRWLRTSPRTGPRSPFTMFTSPESAVDFQYRKTADSMCSKSSAPGAGDCWVEFSPAFSLRTQVVSVEMNGRAVAVQNSAEQQRSAFVGAFPVNGGANSLVIRVRNDFGLALVE